MDQQRCGITMSTNGNPLKIHILKGSGLTIQCKKRHNGNTIEAYQECHTDEIPFNTSWCKWCLKKYNGKAMILEKQEKTPVILEQKNQDFFNNFFLQDKNIKEFTKICKYCNLSINESSFLINHNYFFHSNTVKPCYLLYINSNNSLFELTKDSLIFKYPHSNNLTFIQWHITIRNKPNHEFQNNIISSSGTSDELNGEINSSISFEKNKLNEECNTFDITTFFI